MSVYFSPIIFGVFASFIIFYIISLPVAIIQYRKYNGILPKKTFVLASFILYMVVAWFMTILPLPSRQAVAAMEPIVPNFKPFLFVTDFFKKSGFSLHDKSTWLKAVKTNSFYTVAFNVLLTFPFGVYMRKYFKKTFCQTLLFGFLLTFFYELTQYTGLYGIYPKAYRLADVDDLIVNTFGVVLGFISTPIISRLLPTVEASALPVEKQIDVGLIRRLIAFGTDLFIIQITKAVLMLPFSLLHISIPFIVDTLLHSSLYLLCFFLFPYLTKGKTLGLQLVKIKITSTNAKPLAFWQIALRNGCILLFTALLPFINKTLLPNNATYSSFQRISTFLALAFPLVIIVSGFRKKYIYFYEKLSSTRLISQHIYLSPSSLKD